MTADKKTADEYKKALGLSGAEFQQIKITPSLEQLKNMPAGSEKAILDNTNIKIEFKKP